MFLAGESTWTEEPGGLWSVRSQRVGHDWVTRYSTQITLCSPSSFPVPAVAAAAAAAKLLQSCPTLSDPIDPPGSPIPGILQARTLEWVAIFFSNAWKWKVKVKSFSRVRLFVTHGLQPTRLLHPWDFPGKSTGVGCHCLLRDHLSRPYLIPEIKKNKKPKGEQRLLKSYYNHFLFITKLGKQSYRISCVYLDECMSQCVSFVFLIILLIAEISL